MRHGFGKLVDIDGEYTGGFERGKSMVKKLCLADGSTIAGEWENGRLKSGRLEFANGDRYEGRFEMDKPDGSGCFFCKETGTLLKGCSKMVLRMAKDNCLWNQVARSLLERSSMVEWRLADMRTLTVAATLEVLTKRILNMVKVPSFLMPTETSCTRAEWKTA